MKLGIFSDIHGNLFSFENIYRELLKEKCDMHLFLGDICGYYYRQKEIMDMLKDMPRLESIVGNHDALFLESLEDENMMKNYTDKYGLSFRFLKETIAPDQLDFLRDLPREFHLETEGIAAFHGSPWDPIEEYIYPDSPMERFTELPFKIVFLGHTHHPMDKKLEGIRVINPGSAGQPRNGGWPTYAVYDTRTKELQIKQVQYNVNALADEIKNRKDENPYLIRALHRIKKWQN